MKKVNWLIVGIIAVILLLFLFGGGMMMGGWGYPGWGMMGWGYSPLGFGWGSMIFAMLFMGLIPAGMIALIVFGIATLIRSSGNGVQLSSLKPCPNCGKGIQADWQNCPYCGKNLK
jgi:hypothetical protein